MCYFLLGQSFPFSSYLSAHTHNCSCVVYFPLSIIFLPFRMVIFSFFFVCVLFFGVSLQKNVKTLFTLLHIPLSPTTITFSHLILSIFFILNFFPYVISCWLYVICIISGVLCMLCHSYSLLNVVCFASFFCCCSFGKLTDIWLFFRFYLYRIKIHVRHFNEHICLIKICFSLRIHSLHLQPWYCSLDRLYL